MIRNQYYLIDSFYRGKWARKKPQWDESSASTNSKWYPCEYQLCLWAVIVTCDL